MLNHVKPPITTTNHSLKLKHLTLIKAIYLRVTMASPLVPSIRITSEEAVEQNPVVKEHSLEAAKRTVAATFEKDGLVPRQKSRDLQGEDDQITLEIGKNDGKINDNK
jgi:hypothetical protein